MLFVSRNTKQNKNFFQINWSILVYHCLKVQFLICGWGLTKRVNNQLLCGVFSGIGDWYLLEECYMLWLVVLVALYFSIGINFLLL